MKGPEPSRESYKFADGLIRAADPQATIGKESAKTAHRLRDHLDSTTAIPVERTREVVRNDLPENFHIELSPEEKAEMLVEEALFDILTLKYPNFDPEKKVLVEKHPKIINLKQNINNTLLMPHEQLALVIEDALVDILGQPKQAH